MVGWEGDLRGVHGKGKGKLVVEVAEVCHASRLRWISCSRGTTLVLTPLPTAVPLQVSPPSPPFFPSREGSVRPGFVCQFMQTVTGTPWSGPSWD